MAPCPTQIQDRFWLWILDNITTWYGITRYGGKNLHKAGSLTNNRKLRGLLSAERTQSATWTPQKVCHERSVSKPALVGQNKNLQEPRMAYWLNQRMPWKYITQKMKIFIYIISCRRGTINLEKHLIHLNILPPIKRVHF